MQILDIDALRECIREVINEDNSENEVLRISRDIKNKYDGDLFKLYTIAKNLLGYICLDLQEKKNTSKDNILREQIKDLEKVFYLLQEIDIRKLNASEKSK